MSFLIAKLNAMFIYHNSNLKTKKFYTIAFLLFGGMNLENFNMPLQIFSQKILERQDN